MPRACERLLELIATPATHAIRLSRSRLSLLLLLGLASSLVAATLQTNAHACDFCLGNSPLVPPGPNTYWSLVDNLTACPAGDSVTAGHPARLRIEVVTFPPEADSV
jgi:hypothetical protein